VFPSVLTLIPTLPAEFVLLKALQSPDDQTAARDGWRTDSADLKPAPTAFRHFRSSIVARALTTAR
jgi:hypothetical protein